MDTTVIKAALILGGAWALYSGWRTLNLGDLQDNSAAFYEPMLYEKIYLLGTDDIITFYRKYGLDNGSGSVVPDEFIGYQKYAETTSYRNVAYPLNQ